MADQPIRKIDPALIFEQADCFYQTLAVLCNVRPDDEQLGVILGEPAMVIGALTIELFFKCMACIETGQVPRGHHLRELYDALSDQTRARIQRTWDNDICVYRKAEWDANEAAIGEKVIRDLPGALTAASKSFEKIRYSYEGDTEGLQYFLQDLPQLLGRVILEMRPEFQSVRRKPLPLPPAP